MNFQDTEVRPGEVAVLNIYSSPGSLCSLKVQDKSLGLLQEGRDPATHITTDLVISKLIEYSGVIIVPATCTQIICRN